MDILTKEQIIAAKDLQPIEVEVPEWNGKVLIRQFTGLERFELQETLKQFGTDDEKNATEKLIAMGLCDADGQRLFSDNEVTELAKKNMKVLNKLAMDIMQHNKMTNDSLDEAVKNSDPDQNVD